MKGKLKSLLVAAALSACGMPVMAQAPIASALGLPPATSAPAAVAKCDAPVCAINNCDECPGGYFTAGAAFYFLSQFNSSNSAGYYTVASPAAGTFNLNQGNFGQHVDGAPLIWAGYTWENGWGVRARWFEYSGSEQALATDPAGSGTLIVSNIFPVTALFPGSGEQFQSSRSLALNNIDLEATNNFVWGRWALLASVGLRYSHISSNFNAEYETTATPNFVINSYAANATFNGIGPTMSLEGRRRVGETDFFLYGSARGSLLFGSLHRSSTATYGGFGDIVDGVVPGVKGGDPTINLASDESTLMAVAEMELGGEWAKTFANGRLRAFVQLAFVGQMYIGGSSSPNGQGIAEAPLSFIGLGGFGNNANNFGFMGGVVKAGVSF